MGEIIAWRVANIILLIWCSIGVTISLLWIINSLKVKKIKMILLVMLLFLGFSGLDFIGVFLNNSRSSFDQIHLEWWAYYFQFSSMITQLFWVFNQCIIPWLITIMFLNEKKVSNYLLLLLICFTYGPMSFIGMTIFMLARGIILLKQSIKEKTIIEFIKEILSIENIFAFISILPIYYLYYQNNSAINDGGIRIITEILNIGGIKLLIEFYILEVGIYGLLLWKENKNDELFIISLISLLFIPCIGLGLEYDFSMRVSIPALTIINYCFVKYIIEEFRSIKIESLYQIFKKNNVNVKLVIAMGIFSIGLITPFVEIQRGIFNIKVNKKINLVSDSIVTLENKDSQDILNFICLNPEKNSMFYRYLAK